jgi:hypothetical protein
VSLALAVGLRLAKSDCLFARDPQGHLLHIILRHRFCKSGHGLAPKLKFGHDLMQSGDGLMQAG